MSHDQTLPESGSTLKAVGLIGPARTCWPQPASRCWKAIRAAGLANQAGLRHAGRRVTRDVRFRRRHEWAARRPPHRQARGPPS